MGYVQYSATWGFYWHYLEKPTQVLLTSGVANPRFYAVQPMPRKAFGGTAIVCSVLCKKMSAWSDSCSITEESSFTRLWVACRGLEILLRETVQRSVLKRQLLKSEQYRVLGLSCLSMEAQDREATLCSIQTGGITGKQLVFILLQLKEGWNKACDPTD